MGSFPFWWTASTCGSFNSCTVCLLAGSEEDGCSSLQWGACRLWRGNWRRRRKPWLASCWACRVLLKTVGFVYLTPQCVMVEKGFYQNHGQPYAHIHADFLDLLLKRRYLLYTFLLLSSPKLLLNTLFPGTWYYGGRRGLVFFPQVIEKEENSTSPLLPNLLKQLLLSTLFRSCASKKSKIGNEKWKSLWIEMHLKVVILIFPFCNFWLHCVEVTFVQGVSTWCGVFKVLAAKVLILGRHNKWAFSRVPAACSSALHRWQECSFW